MPPQCNFPLSFHDIHHDQYQKEIGITTLLNSDDRRIEAVLGHFIELVVNAWSADPFGVLVQCLLGVSSET